MNQKRARTVGPLLTASALSACTGIQGGSEPADDGATGSTLPAAGRYCKAMSHLVELLEPHESSSPDETQATFEEAALWFAQARDAAPESIASDVEAHADAHEKYIRFLDEVDYRLDAVFSSPEGNDLAVGTSHSLTPAIVEYVRDECGISFGDVT